MSNVPNTSLHSFANGETVTQDMLNQDIQVLQSAVNDNDTRLTTLQSANQGALSKIPSGIAFPSNPQQGWIFFRTDVGTTGTLYIYDSTNNWNADPSLIKYWIQNNLGLGVTQNTNVISGSVDLNNYKTSGFYYVSGTVTNQPIAGTSGYLLVQAGNDGSKVTQTYITEGAAIPYTRQLTSGSWVSWYGESIKPYLRLELTGNPALANNTDVVLTQGCYVIGENIGNWVAQSGGDGTWTVPITGIYMVTCYGAIAFPSVGSEFQIKLYHVYGAGGAYTEKLVVADEVASSASKWIYTTGSLAIHLNAGDRIGMAWYQNGSGSQTIEQARLTAVLINKVS